MNAAKEFEFMQRYKYVEESVVVVVVELRIHGSVYSRLR